MPRAIRAEPQLEHAVTAFEQGRYEEAREVASRLAARPGAVALDATLLAARVDLRLGDVAAVIERLEPLARRLPPDVTAQTLLGIALFRQGEESRGALMIENAHAGARDAVGRSEAAYYRAWAAYAQRRLDDAERWIAESLDDAQGVVYARGLALSAWVVEARGDYPGAARAFRLALAALRSGTERDDELVARILHMLAVFAAELPDASLAAYFRTQQHGFAWPPSRVDDAFNAQLHSGLAFVNDGDADAAFDAFDAAEGVAAERSVLAAQARLETAELFRVLGEATAARRAMRAASQMLRAVAWNEAGIAEHMGLLEATCVAARLDPMTASEWLVRYAALPKNDVSWHALTGDMRVAATELHARGIVEAALGRKNGVARLHEAFALWQRLGYRRRAAYAAADLAAAGDTASGDRIAALLEKAPHHPLLAQRHGGASGLPHSASAAPRANASAAERKVLEALCAGWSVRQMAQEWDRSEFTIRNHLKRLFAKYGVRSSAALVAKAMSGGAAAPPLERVP
jgi:ATP/maltotriose-dependent transcriptional regulator MalT